MDVHLDRSARRGEEYTTDKLRITDGDDYLYYDGQAPGGKMSTIRFQYM